MDTHSAEVTALQAERLIDQLHMRVALAERDIGQLRMLLQAQHSQLAALRAKTEGWPSAV
jgi:hypothetical protein